MTATNWKIWDSSADLSAVPGLREAIHGAQIRPLLDVKEADALKRTILETFTEVLDIYLEDNELRWRCDLVNRTFPLLPMQAVFRAIELELGISVSRLSKVWYDGNRRKARIQEIVSKKLKERRP
jgi:hypothetical protein